MNKLIKTVATGVSLVSLIALTAAQADAQRRGGGGGRAASMSTNRASVGGSRQVRSSASGNVNQVGNRANSQIANNSGNRTNINNGNRTNINTGDVNINRDVDIDVDHGWGCCHGNGWGGYYTGVVVGATVATATAWRLGAYYSTLPANCVVVYRGSISYYQCGTYWYQPMYSGMTVTYVAVKAP